jgi:hypothetical protein
VVAQLLDESRVLPAQRQQLLVRALFRKRLRRSRTDQMKFRQPFRWLSPLAPVLSRSWLNREDYMIMWSILG